MRLFVFHTKGGGDSLALTLDREGKTLPPDVGEWQLFAHCAPGSLRLLADGRKGVVGMVAAIKRDGYFILEPSVLEPAPSARAAIISPAIQNVHHSDGGKVDCPRKVSERPRLACARAVVPSLAI
jgi:hypothetical protein